MNIPQAEADIKGVAEKSGRACAKVVPLMVAQGMVWLWPDNSPEGLAASRQQPPNTVPELHDPAFVKGAWVTRDLEYGYDTLIENVVDPAHVPFAHHGVQAQRSMAMPLNVSLNYAGPEGVFLCLPRLANSTIGACACVSVCVRACAGGPRTLPDSSPPPQPLPRTQHLNPLSIPEFHAPTRLQYKFDFSGFFERVPLLKWVFRLEKRIRGLPAAMKPHSCLVTYTIPV